MRVTVIVLNWNGREDTLACLRSLQDVAEPGMRVLVVDNGSEDGSEEAIVEAFPAIDLLQTGANLGFAGGNNVGIERALADGAEAVLLLNNDTEVDSGFLRPMLAELENSPRTGIVGASIAYHHDPQRLWAWGGGHFDVATGWVRHLQAPQSPGVVQESRRNRYFYVTGCTMLLRRALIEEVGMLSTDYFHFCEDVDLCLRAGRAGWKLAVATESRLLHKVSATTRVSSPTFLYYNLRSRLGLVRRFGPPGAPSRRALAVLWMRLWRPTLLSGQGRSGWKALELAWRDFQNHETGPAPSELSR